MLSVYNVPFLREVGKFELGAHLRERGQKPEVLRQVGGRVGNIPYPYHFRAHSVLYGHTDTCYFLIVP